MAVVSTKPAEQAPENFEGTVIKRDPDGFGYIEITTPGTLFKQVGVFTSEVLEDPAVSRDTKKGSHVTGRVLHSRGGGLKVLRIDPKR